jgi:hypothetical protein
VKECKLLSILLDEDKILNINIKTTRQKKNLKTGSVYSENTDLILKMIKKAKISRVRVPLTNTTEQFNFNQAFMITPCN